MFTEKNLRAKVREVESYLEDLSDETKNNVLLGSLLVGVVVLPGVLRIAAVAGLVVCGASSIAANRNIAPHPTIGWKPFLGNDLDVLNGLQTESIVTMKRLSTEGNFKNFDLHFVGTYMVHNDCKL
jgi:hypothetical protein